MLRLIPLVVVFLFSQNASGEPPSSGQATILGTGVQNAVTTEVKPQRPLPSDGAKGAASVSLKDESTDLTWSPIQHLRVKHSVAKRLCDALVLGGWDDWRLPEADELEDAYQSKLFISVKSPWLTKEQLDWYFWSSNQVTYRSDYNGYYAFYLAGGQLSDSTRNLEGSVLCVRGQRKLNRRSTVLGHAEEHQWFYDSRKRAQEAERRDAERWRSGNY
jgi:hypothetical protein